MKSAAFQKGVSHYLEGRPITWGINYFKDEPLAMEEWLLGWCAEANKDYSTMPNSEEPFCWRDHRDKLKIARSNNRLPDQEINIPV